MAGGLSYTAEQSTSLSTAEIYGQALVELAEAHPEVVALTADLAKSTKIGDFQKKFPDRFFNVGIAEQNMFGIAAGMASYGYIPFISSFTPFATRRICDQITISICYANQNVKIIGTDPGISAEYNGGTHMSVEDIGVLRSIPNLVIYEPVDAVQLYKSLPVILNYEGPSVTVIENVGAGSKATTYQSEKPDYILHTVSDPDFIKAEAHIMRLLEEPDEADI